MRTKLLITAVTFLLLTSAGYVQAATSALSADDFLPPARGGSTEIAAPDEIKVEGDVVTAATLQDAAIKAAELTSRAAANPDLEGFLGMVIASGAGGRGAIATGSASYATNATNRDAIRLAKRHAYVMAFTRAKANLMRYLHESISHEGLNVLFQGQATIVRDDETLEHGLRFLTEDVKERFEGFIQAYEVFSVEHCPEESAIRVTIGINEKSIGKSARISPVVIQNNDIRTALTQVFNEIESGISIPTGGRVIMTDIGNVFVGYGSALIIEHDDPVRRSRAMDNARRIAETRARDSLVGLIRGDQVVWQNILDEQSKSAWADFEEIPGTDAIMNRLPDAVTRLAESRDRAVTMTVTAEEMTALRRGVLPPGVMQRSFRDKNNEWYYAVAVYNATASQNAADFAEEMRNAVLVEPIRPPQPQTQNQNRASGTGTTPSNVVRPSTDVHMIPTGTFRNNQ